MKTVPLWQEQAPMPSFIGRNSSGPTSVEVAVIGGGYTGLIASRRLSTLGIKTAVFESGLIGSGASSRNGGKALVGLKKHASIVVGKYGTEIGTALWNASLQGIDLVKKIITEEGIDCDFEQNGSLYLASKPRHYDQMRRESEWLYKHLSYCRENVSCSDIGGEIGTNCYFGGVIDKASAGLHPGKWVRGLAEAALRAGVILCAKMGVLRLERQAGKWILYTEKGKVTAEEVLIATNGYTGNLVGSIQRRVLPVGSYIIATDPLSPTLQEKLSPKSRLFYDSKWFLKYFRITKDGRMLFGGRTTISPNQNLEQSAKILRQDMVSMFPDLAKQSISHCWSGQLGMTFDAMPHVGRREGIWYALGYGGHGVALSTVLAEDVALVLSGRKKSSLFMEIPHKTNFFYHGNPWIRPFVGFGLRMLDLFT